MRGIDEAAQGFPPLFCGASALRPGMQLALWTALGLLFGWLTECSSENVDTIQDLDQARKHYETSSLRLPSLLRSKHPNRAAIRLLHADDLFAVRNVWG